MLAWPDPRPLGPTPDPRSLTVAAALPLAPLVGRKWRGQFAGKPITNAAANTIKRTAYLLSIFCQVGGAAHLAPVGHRKIEIPA